MIAALVAGLALVATVGSGRSLVRPSHAGTHRDGVHRLGYRTAGGIEERFSTEDCENNNQVAANAD